MHGHACSSLAGKGSSRGTKERHVRKRLVIIGLAAAGFTIGGIAGVTLGTPGLLGAQTNPTTPSTNAPDPNAPGPNAAPNSSAKPSSNEDPAHESKETPEQEAAEDSGQLHHGGRHGSNEDPAHEATESPEREAQEHGNGSGAAPPTGQTPSSPTTPSGGTGYFPHSRGSGRTTNV
jgi:hypothetical protein